MACRRIAVIGLLSAIFGGPWAWAEEQKVPAQEPGAKSRYLRLTRDWLGNPVAMETAIVRFKPRGSARTAPTVDLVGAVHIADRAYYEQLNRQFAGYDAVLYELVAPAGTKVPEGGAKQATNALSAVQLGLKDLLELEFQLNSIHYNRPNMVHADMSPEQFAESMRQRGESFVGIFLRMLAAALARQSDDNSGGADMQLLMALFDKNRALALKRLMAEQFQDMEGSLMALEGPQGSTLVSQRNKVALDVLKKELSAGKQNLAIFYGAGHMTDMEQRLRKDFDLVPVETHWLVAWNLKSSAAAAKPAPAAVPAGK